MTFKLRRPVKAQYTKSLWMIGPFMTALFGVRFILLLLFFGEVTNIVVLLQWSKYIKFYLGLFFTRMNE